MGTTKYRTAIALRDMLPFRSSLHSLVDTFTGCSMSTRRVARALQVFTDQEVLGLIPDDVLPAVSVQELPQVSVSHGDVH